MKRALLALFAVAATVTILAWPLSQAIGVASAGEPAVCRHMTPARMLENPALAEEWAQALRSAHPDAVARLRALFSEIRAAHGCPGGLAMPSPGPEAGALPPGHPPVPGHGLPPGHPPIPSSPSSPRAPLFEAPALLTI
jgi:hypothetical protein